MSFQERMMNHAYSFFVDMFLTYLNDHLIHQERANKLKIDIPLNNDILRLVTVKTTIKCTMSLIVSGNVSVYSCPTAIH